MTISTISIIIPARNEEKNILKCLDFAENQTIPIAEIIVVNDESTDNTLKILETKAYTNEKLKFISINNKPADWIGKNYAIYKGFQESKGDYLVFIDADVEISTNCIEKAMKIMLDNNGDMISFTGYQVCKTFSEYAIQPLIFLILNQLYHVSHSITDNNSSSVANGNFILIKRSIYEDIGTHESIKSFVLEDVELAKTVTNANYKNIFLYKPDLLKVRMYSSLPEIIEGWSKNIFELMRFNLFISLLTITLLLNWIPAILLYFTGFIILTHLISWIVLLGLFFCYTYFKMGYKFWYGLLFPAGTTITSIIIINSIICYYLKGSVKWKDRTYYVKKP